MIFADYAEVPGGHVRPEDREALKGVIGVPIWWRDDIIGSWSCSPATQPGVLDEDAELLELFAKHAAIAITNARLHEAAESNARAEAAAAERNRMAREVHDTVAQGLVSVFLQLRAAQGAIADGQPDDASGRSTKPGPRPRPPSRRPAGASSGWRRRRWRAARSRRRSSWSSPGRTGPGCSTCAWSRPAAGRAAARGSPTRCSASRRRP